MKKSKHSRNKNNFHSNLAGVGGGTLLVLLAKNLPDTVAYKSWLIIIAPSVSIILSNSWKWLSNLVDDYLAQKRQAAIVNQYRSSIKNALNDPDVPDYIKEILSKKLGDFELQYIELLASTKVAKTAESMMEYGL